MKILANQSKRSLSVKMLATTALVALAIPAFAGPEGGVITAGSATISTSGNTTNIDTQSENVAGEFTSFDTNPNEIVNINQLSNRSTFLAIVNNTAPTQFFGQLNANGNVVLSNRNGVLFGKTARVDVNSLIATTAVPINTDHFIHDGVVQFDQASNPNAAVINNGVISAADAGLVGLVAPHVENNGVIIARLGRAHLASGDTATVDLFGDGLIEVALENDASSQSIINTGLIMAEGGTIALTAAAGKSIVDSLITVSGELHAPSFAEKNGKIIIYGAGSNAVIDNNSIDKNQKQGQSTILVDGLLNASGYRAGEIGGQIEILGDQIAVLDGTVIDTSGDQGGGNIKIGGDYLGLGETPTAYTTHIDDSAFIFSDAKTSGDGGRIIVWADDTTQFHGNIFARGGINAGNGGFVETSGKRSLSATGFVDLTARHHSGDKGVYLLDPENIMIYGDFNPLDIAGNVLWLDGADPASIVDGQGNAASNDGFDGSVAVWQDKSGQGNDLSNDKVISQPNYNETGRNNQGSVYFNKSSFLLATDDDVPSLDLTGDELSYYGVVSPAFETGVQTLFAKENSYAAAIRNDRFQAQVETTDAGFWNWGGTKRLTQQWQQLGFQHADTDWNFFQNGNLLQSITPANNEIGNIQSSDSDFTLGARIDNNGQARDTFTGNMAEVLMYDRVLDQSSQDLLNQYQAAKWDIDLGKKLEDYSQFTTRYLEKLSETADVHLLASNNITLDLKGDRIALAEDRSISLTTEYGDITSISGGSIATSRLNGGGNIKMTAGDEGSIDLSDLSLISDGGAIALHVDQGSIAYHQNYVEPVLSIPQTVQTRRPTVQTQQISTPSSIKSLKGLDDFISFDNGSNQSSLSSEDEIEQ